MFCNLVQVLKDNKAKLLEFLCVYRYTLYIIVSPKAIPARLLEFCFFAQAGEDGYFEEEERFNTTCTYLNYNELFVPTSLESSSRRKRAADNATGKAGCIKPTLVLQSPMGAKYIFMFSGNTCICLMDFSFAERKQTLKHSLIFTFIELLQNFVFVNILSASFSPFQN